jgi:adenine phosphoribosyltransferase
VPVDLASLIVDVPDFPRPGIVFFDITPLLASPAGLAATVDRLVAAAPPADLVVGIEARGFLLAAPVAYRLGLGLVPVRKPGKLPRPVVAVDYELEYRTDTLAVHADAIPPGSRVLVVDDVLATGGTVAATGDLVAKVGGTVVGVLVLAELPELAPRERLAAHGLTEVTSLLTLGDG